MPRLYAAGQPEVKIYLGYILLHILSL